MAGAYLSDEVWVGYSETKNSNFTTTLSITSIEIYVKKSDNSASWNILSSSLSIGGSSVSPGVTTGLTDRWVEIWSGNRSFTIYHDDTTGAPTSSVYISVSARVHQSNWSSSSAYSTYSGSGYVGVSAFPAQRLTISNGVGATATVYRNGTQLSNGASVFQGQVLYVYFTPAANYEVDVHTVNGTPFASGGAHTVYGAVTVVTSGKILSNVFIDGERYLTFIDNGTTFEQYRAYIDNGSGWEVY